MGKAESRKLNPSLSIIRAAAGRAGAAARWGDRPRASACVRLYPADAARIRAAAAGAGRMPADVVRDLIDAAPPGVV